MTNAANVIKFNFWDFLEVNDKAKTIHLEKDFTIIIDVNVQSNSNDIILFHATNFLTIGLSSNKAFMKIKDQEPIYLQLSNTEFLKTDWYTLAVSHKNGCLTLFSDKDEDNVVTCQANFPSIDDEDLNVSIGKGLNGYISYLAVYNEALSQESVFYIDSNKPQMTENINLWLSGDSTKITDESLYHENYRISHSENCEVVNITYCYKVAYGGSLKPLNDINVNPGGEPVGAYSLSSKIYFVPTSYQIKFYIASNSDMENDSGMALYIEKDLADNEYYICSQRGQDLDSQNKLRAKLAKEFQHCWINVATVFNGVSLKIYLNGQLVAEDDASLPNTQYRKNGTLIIGDSIHTSSDIGNLNFLGYIQNLYVFNDALTDEEINNCIKSDVSDIQCAVGIYSFINETVANEISGNIVSSFSNIGFVVAENLSDLVDANTIKTEYSAIIRPHVSCKALTAEDIEKINEMWSSIKDNSTNVNIPIINQTINLPLKKLETAIQNLKVGDKLSYRVWSYEHEGKVHFACNCPFEGEKVIGSVDIGTYDDYTKWQIELALTIIIGAIGIIFSISCISTLSSNLTNYVAKNIITSLSFSKAIGLGLGINAADILTLICSIQQKGHLTQIIKMSFKVRFFTFLKIIAKLIALCLGWGWLVVLIEIGCLVVRIITVINQRPKREEELTVYVLKNTIFRFNPTEFSSSSAYIRKDALKEESIYEICGGVPMNTPILYFSKKLKKPVIKASFTASSTSKSVKKGPVKVQIITDSCILGDSNIATIEFVNGKQVPETVDLNFGLKFMPGQMGKETAKFSWLIDGKIVAITQHRIYLLADLPSQPIDIYNNNENNIIESYVRIFLDYLYDQDIQKQMPPFCSSWLLDVSTPETIIDDICKVIYNDDRLIYDGVEYYSIRERRYNEQSLPIGFKADLFSKDYNNEKIKKIFMDCVDFSSLFLYYQNLFYNELSEYQYLITLIYNAGSNDDFYSNGMPLKTIIPKGWPDIFQENKHFGFHSVVLKIPLNRDYFEYTDKVFDISLEYVYEINQVWYVRKPRNQPFSLTGNNKDYHPNEIGDVNDSYRECVFYAFYNNENRTGEIYFTNAFTQVLSNDQNRPAFPIDPHPLTKSRLSELKKYTHTVELNGLSHKYRQHLYGKNFKDIYSSENNEQLSIALECFNDIETCAKKYEDKICSISFYEKVIVDGFEKATKTVNPYLTTFVLQKNTQLITIAIETALLSQIDHIIKHFATL